MRKIALAILLLSAAPFGAQAQIVPPPVPSMTPPLPGPSAPPPPRIEVPEVPKMDSPPKAPKAAPVRRSSFNDRVLNCLDDGYARRLSPAERGGYTRSCANQLD